jgi:hypothetical protein
MRVDLVSLLRRAAQPLQHSPFRHAQREAAGPQLNFAQPHLEHNVSNLAPGWYEVHAKINLDNDDTVSTHTVTTQLLRSPLVGGISDKDFNQIRLAPSGVTKVDNAVVAHHFITPINGANDSIKLKCQSNNAFDNVSYRYARLMAIKTN